ncbi:MAG: hypothetical protein ACE37H_15965 [Phycisphaeraceae bacterium]
MQQPTPATPATGFKAWQLALTVVAVALIVRVGLGALPTPIEQADEDRAAERDAAQKVADRHAPTDAHQNNAPADDDFELSAVEVLPFNLKGEVPGPLLTSILQRYLPDSTPDHADALRDTLPPGQDPRMIVIIPDEDDGAMF